VRLGTKKLTIHSGAGFYLNATAEKYKKHYNMYNLIVKELPEVLKEANLGLVGPTSILRGSRRPSGPAES